MFFDVSRYLRDKCFDMVWGYHPIRGPQKINFYLPRVGALVFFDISRFLGDKFFDIGWGITPADPPQNGPPKN